MTASRRYCLVTPCRDEERYARRTLDAVIAQTIRPALWVIVDDGSSDDTPRILAEYAERHPFIRIVRRPDRGDRKLGGGVIDAFYEGYHSVDSSHFDYVCKLDLDLDLPRGYFETLMTRMEADPRIGTCSGKPYFVRHNAPAASIEFPIVNTRGLVSEMLADDNSVGMIKFYRTACFQQIGGFVRELMWDGIDGHRCRQLGWIATSWDDPELRFIHLRPMGTSHRNWWTGRVRHGIGQYYMGTDPIYLLASAAFRMTRPPRIVGGLAILRGYFGSMIQRRQRFGDVTFRRFLRSYQRACLLKGRAAATRELELRQLPVWNARAHLLSPSDVGSDRTPRMPG